MEAVSVNTAETVRLLVRHHADTALRNTEGKTAIDMAQRRPAIQSILAGH